MDVISCTQISVTSFESALIVSHYSAAVRTDMHDVQTAVYTARNDAAPPYTSQQADSSAEKPCQTARLVVNGGSDCGATELTDDTRRHVTVIVQRSGDRAYGLHKNHMFRACSVACIRLCVILVGGRRFSAGCPLLLLRLLTRHFRLG